MDIGKIQLVEISTEMQKSYLDYAMSVIVSRALPDVRDGLKPVHRRILFAMHQLGLSHTARYSKSAKVVGEVLGKYHPHGDVPVYDALVRLAQDFSMRYPLVHGQGNFGSVDGDPPAAMRYTEVKLQRIAEEMLLDLEKGTVDFVPNFDATLAEPVFLSSRLPNLLLMGSEGIAVGMATKIPPHNLGEVVDALVFMLKRGLVKPISSRFESDVTVEELLQFIKGPDFPTGGSIYDIREIMAAYATGKGKIVMQAKAEIEDIGQGKSAIIVTELPYQVNKAQLVAKIADLAKEKKIVGISDLRDESDRHGIRVVIELKRDAKPRTVLHNLFKHTSMQTTFPVNVVALVDGAPQTLTLKVILEEYIRHRQRVVTRRSEFELKEARARLHILEGLKIAVDHIDEVIAIIKQSKDAESAKANLMQRFGLSELQATAILDMQLRRLAALERQKIEDEYEMVKETIAYLESLLSHPEKILGVIEEEITKIKEKYADARRTKVYKSKVGEFSEEDLIHEEQTVIIVTESGYIKRQSLNSFRTQQRGGKGIIGMTTKDADQIAHLLSASTHDNILFFTNQGKVYQLKVWELPEGTRISKGQAVVNLINIATGEKISSILTYSSDGKEKLKDSYIFMTTHKGTVKKTTLSEYANIRRTGLIAIKLDKDDELCWTKLTTDKENVILITREGKGIRFNEVQVRATKRDTMGVRGIFCKKEDYVIGMDVVKSDKDTLLIITERGLGKKSQLSDFPKQGRGGQGVKAHEITNRTGKVVTAEIIPQKCQNIILTSLKGQIVKLPNATVPCLGRSTQGVILMRFSDPDDYLAAATCLEEE